MTELALLTNQPRRPAGPAHRPPLLLLLAVACSVCSALPTSLPRKGTLLATAPVKLGGEPEPTLEVGVYGPRPPTADEPASVSLVIAGSDAVEISHGLVLMACDQSAVSLGGVPAPAGAYVPPGQWAPNLQGEWRQFLALSAQGLWAMRISAMAHTDFEASAGPLLDAVVYQQPWVRPPPGSPFLDHGKHDSTGVAFVADDTVYAPAQIKEAIHGAHGVSISFPLIFKDPATTLSFWVALTVNGARLTHGFAVKMSPDEAGADGEEAASEAPVLHEPAEGTAVGKTVQISGQAKPGSLVVAWLEVHDPDKPTEQQTQAPARHIAGQFGGFSIMLPMPATDTNLTYELHVRTEAPGYRSPTTIRRIVPASQAPNSPDQ